MKLDELVTRGFLTEDKWVVPLRTTDGEVLTPRQALRVYGHTKRASLPDGLGELCDPSLEARPVHVVPEDAYAFTAAMDVQWKAQGVFPYDTSQMPEPYDALCMPRVVKRAMDRVLIPFSTREDLVNLVRRYNGEFDGVAGDTQALRALRRQPVIRRLCASSSCNELVLMSLRVAVISIEMYGLLPEAVLREHHLKTDGHTYLASRSFRPHSLCSTCAAQRQAGPHRGHPGTKSAQGPDKAKSSPRQYTSSRWQPTLGDVTKES